jgi:riboflavin synthase
MFTGIVEVTAKVTKADHHDQWLTLCVEVPKEYVVDIELGSSISINGVCLTVSKITEDSIRFDVVHESLQRTTLQRVVVGDYVNLQRSMKAGAEIGGHLMSGHIDGIAEVTAITRSEGNYSIDCILEKHLRKYVFSKGFIGIHGCSLTVCDMNSVVGTFTVWLIPETLRRTNLGALMVGDYVNIEVHRETQVQVDTIERYLAEAITDGKISAR